MWALSFANSKHDGGDGNVLAPNGIPVDGTTAKRSIAMKELDRGTRGNAERQQAVPARNFRMAQKEDAAQILSLYQNAKKEPLCAWDDSYPSTRDIEQDLRSGNLYVMTVGRKIIGAISVAPENEMDSFDGWSCKNGKEIARVVVAGDYRGQGIALEMVWHVERILRESGCGAIHLAVAKSNIPAYKTYVKAGLTVAGEADLYGDRHILMEKSLCQEGLKMRDML